LLLVMLGVLLSINTGRKLARRSHDAALARKYGRSLPGMAHIVYIYMFAAFIFNTLSIVFMRLASTGIQLFISSIMHSIISTITGLVLTTLLILISYIFFSKRYENVEHPLTLEGKIALRGLGAIDGAKEKLKSKIRKEKQR
jgi:uncharacterized membrane protein